MNEIKKETASATFETSDFYVACFLKARGDKLLGAKDITKNKKIFIFAFTDQDEIVKKFYNDEVEIRPSKFISAMRDLKGYTRENNIKGA